MLPTFSMATGAGGETQPTSVLCWPAVLAGTSKEPTGKDLGIEGPSAEVASLPGFGSVTPKLIKKIVAREYVDIWELLPETWQVEETDGSCCHSK